MSRRRLEALEALAGDPGATDAERALAASRAEALRAMLGPGAGVEVDVPDELLDALDRAMFRLSKIKHGAYRRGALHAAYDRFGYATVKQWQDNRRAIQR